MTDEVEPIMAKALSDTFNFVLKIGTANKDPIKQ